MGDAVQIERRRLGRFYDRADGNFHRRTRQLVPAMSPARAADEASPPHAQQNLLDVVRGQLLSRGDLATGDRPFGRASRQMQRADDAVLGKRGYSHVSEYSRTQERVSRSS